MGGLAVGSDRADREWLYPRKPFKGSGTSGSSVGKGTSARQAVSAVAGDAGRRDAVLSGWWLVYVRCKRG